MKPRNNILLASLAIGLFSLGSVGCKNKNKGDTDEPGGTSQAEKAALDPTKATAEAKEDFASVVKRYEAAKGRGALSSAQCDELSNAFADVYKKHGKQMTVSWFNAGAVWDECGNTEKAEDIYLKIVERVPKYDLSYNNLGAIYWKRRQEGKALDYFKKAVEVNITTKAPRNNLAAALRDKYSDNPQQDDFAKAERELQTVLAVDSNNRLAYENLARLYYDRGRLKDKSYLLLAELVITQGLRVFEAAKVESADIWNLKGLLLMQKDNQIDALKAFKKAAEVEPNHADANMNIAMISLRFRDYAQAEKSLNIALKDGRQKKNIETYLAYGVAERGLRKYAEAEKAFKKAMEIRSADPRALYNLGILYQEHIAPAAQKEDFNRKPYETAKEYFNKYVSSATGKKEFDRTVADAKARVANIDELFKAIVEMKALEQEAKRLEELQKKQEAEEMKRLLDLEKKALDAAKKAAEAPPPAEEKPAADPKAGGKPDPKAPAKPDPKAPAKPDPKAPAKPDAAPKPGEKPKTK